MCFCGVRRDEIFFLPKFRLDATATVGYCGVSGDGRALAYHCKTSSIVRVKSLSGGVATCRNRSGFIAVDDSATCLHLSRVIPKRNLEWLPMRERHLREILRS